MAYLAGIREKIWQPLYDAFDVLTGATVATFFDTPASGTKRGDQTNLRSAGQLPAPYMYLVRGFHVEIAEDVDQADAQALITDSVFQFFVNAKPYFEIPVRKMGSGNGPWLGAAATSNAVPFRLVQYVNGVPDSRNYYHLAIPVKIGVLENFRGTLTFPGGVTLGSTRRIKLYLEGVLKRSVQ